MLLVALFTVANLLADTTCVDLKIPQWPKDYVVSGVTPKIPPNLCNECLIDINNVDTKTGDFINGKKLHVVNKDPAEGCMAQVWNYVQDNPEDLQTKAAFNEFAITKNYTSVAYYRVERMIYSNCELCCDCVSLTGEKDSGIIDVTRPNCALHFFWDNTVAGLYPDWEYTDDNGETTGVKMADDLQKWLECYFNLGSGSVQVRPTGLPTRRLLHLKQVKSCSDIQDVVLRVEAELSKLTKRWACNKPQVYQTCWEMEYRMGRVCGGDPLCDTSF